HITSQLPLGFVKQLDRDNRWCFAPNPCALWAIATPRLERPELVFCGLTILGDDSLSIIVPCLPGIDVIGEDVADRGHLPDVVLTRWRGRVGGVQPFGNLPTTQFEFISIKSWLPKRRRTRKLCRAQQRSLTRSRTPTFLGGFGL